MFLILSYYNQPARGCVVVAKLHLILCSWKQLTPVQSWRSCTALVGHKVSRGASVFIWG